MSGAWPWGFLLPLASDLHPELVQSLFDKPWPQTSSDSVAADTPEPTPIAVAETNTPQQRRSAFFSKPLRLVVDNT